jgi:hypothetical protein
MSLFSPAIKPSVSISHHNHHLRTMKLLRAISLTVVLSLSLIKTDAQALYFPPIAGNTWDTLSPAALGWCSSGIDSLYDYLGQRNTKAFILLKDGKIVLERYFGSFTVDSLWYWASAGKPSPPTSQELHNKRVVSHCRILPPPTWATAGHRAHLLKKT